MKFITATFLAVSASTTAIAVVEAAEANNNNAIVNSCTCALLKEEECLTTDCSTVCIWNTTIGGSCQAIGSSSSSSEDYEKWNGYIELGQTHVIMASGETRHAPKAIADREAELLFTPTLDVQPTLAPTPSPTKIIEHEWGLETLGNLNVDVPLGETWDTRFPLRPEANVINEDSNEYYIPASNSNVNINFDLEDNRLIQGIYFKSWYTSVINEIEVGFHIDDGMEGEQPTGDDGTLTIPGTSAAGWIWYTLESVPGCCNYVRQITVPKIQARYVQFKLRGGSRDGGTSDWGIRQIKVSGLLDGNAVIDDDDSEETAATLNSTAFIPPTSHQVRLAGYDSNGKLLGVYEMRSPLKQRPILEQALTTKDLGQYSDEAWSVTVPWNWMKNNNILIVGTADPNNNNQMLLHQLKLNGLKHWGLHVLTRIKLIIFGTTDEAAALDTKTIDSTKVTNGMFNSIPTSELRWVDTKDLHLPYLVISTSNGPKLVTNEQERRDALIDAGDDPSDEPRWEILKNHFAFRHRLAHTGLGLVETSLGCCGSSPYSAGTSILQGWSLSTNTTDPDTNETIWNYNKMGYWGGWAAAAWTGWTGMRPGDECGNLLIHELGHSQTMGHFTTGSSVSRGIEDEYPNDGTNEEWHPWGYDTTSRRFRTWYKHDSETTPPAGKRDPMNGGESSNQETCFPQYTAYHAAKSLNWGSSSPQLLHAGMGPNVIVDGSYKYNTDTKQYDLISTTTEADNLIKDGASVAIETGVPVITIFGTLGASSDVCQIYPELRSRHGNTFELPNPYVQGYNADKFTNAAYMVEVTYDELPTEEVLIGVPAIAIDSTELRFFSFTIALSNKPTLLKLYKFDIDMYPNLSQQSMKTLLYERTLEIGLGSDYANNLPLVIQAGRSWKGESTELHVKGNPCIDLNDCILSSQQISWSQEELKDLIYSSPTSISTPEDAQVTEGNVFPITVTKIEDGSLHTVNIVLSRFAGDNGNPSPLLGTSLASPWDDPLTHGFRAWMPYDINANIPGGTYTTSESNRLKILAHYGDGTFFNEFYIDVEFTMYDKTVVNLSDGATYTSESFSKTGTSAYFLVKDESRYGTTPSNSEWWGGSDGTLEVGLYSDCLPSSDEQVTAEIKALQQNTSPCSTYKWQYNAGQSANDCPHRLVLNLRDEDTVNGINTWMSQYPGCTFTTHPAQPILIDSLTWHNPNANTVLGTLALDISITTPGNRIGTPTTSPTTSPTSTPTETLTWPRCSCESDENDYRGSISITESGKTCMRWDVQTPHTHTRTPENYPNSGLVDNNYCRNPDGTSKAWCYTIDSETRWEYCNVPTCTTGTCPITTTNSPTISLTSSPSTSPTKVPTKIPTGSPTTMSPTKAPTGSPTKNPTKSPTSSPTEIPSKSPTSNPTKNPTKSPSFTPSQSPTKLPTSSPSKSPTSAPTKNPTKLPTSAPTPLNHVWGLEQKVLSYDVVLASGKNASNEWADTYPRDKSRLMVKDTEYYLSTSNPDANLNYDFGTTQEITGVWLQSWYVTGISSIEVGVHDDDNVPFSYSSSATIVPDQLSTGWTWFTLPNISGCCNKIRQVTIPDNVGQARNARYVQIKLRGGTSSYANRWGLRQIQISGTMLNTLPPTTSPTTTPSVSPSKVPTTAPTKNPTKSPTSSPTLNPTRLPTTTPTSNPSKSPTLNPTLSPTTTPSSSPTKLPTSSPTKFQHVWGMEQLVKTDNAALSVVLANPTNDTWPDTSYPRDISRLLEPGSEYYIPNANPNVNLNFDFFIEQEIHGAFIKSWYVTDLPTIEVWVHPDDGTTYDSSIDVVVPSDNSNQWTMYTLNGISGCCNKERYVNIPPTTRARYVQFRLRGGYSSYSSTWGLREVRISGVDLTQTT